MLKHPFVLALALLSLLLPASLVAKDLTHDDALRLRQQGLIMPINELLHIALQRYPQASVLELELEKKHGLFIYEIEILTQTGQVRELKLNAATGDILEDEVDD